MIEVLKRQNIYNKLNSFFFKNKNNLYYNIHSSIYKKIICNKKINSQEIKDFHNLGFFSSENCKEYAIKISNEINKQNSNDEKNYFRFQITNEIKELVKECINEKFNEILKKLESYFNAKVYVSDCQIKRNFSTEEIKETKSDKSNEPFNNFFHCDDYLYNYFKLFINLKDVNDNNGPLNYFSISDGAYFLKKTDYKSRLDYKKISFDKGLKRNTGKIGDSLFMSTPSCFHRAESPRDKTHRDMLFITFLVLPKKKLYGDDYFSLDKNFSNSIWSHDGVINKKFGKPQNLKKTISHLIQFF